MKKIFALALILPLTLSGCSGATMYTKFRNVETLCLVRAVVCDVTGDGKISVSACSGVTQDMQPPKIYTREGETFAEAMEALKLNFTKDSLVFSHVEDLIISEEAAKQGMDSELDFVARSEEMRLSTDLFIVKGSGAKDLLIATASDRTSASDMLLAMKKDVKEMSEGKVTSCGFAASELAKNGVTLVSGITLAENTSPTEDVDQVISPAGYAVVKDGRLIGFVDRDGAKGVNIIKGAAKTSAYTVIDENGEKVTLLMTRAKTDITPEFEDGRLTKIKIETRVKANVDEVSSKTDITKEKVRSGLEKSLSRQIGAQMEEAVKLSQDVDADFMGLGEAVRLSHPIKFSKAVDDWDKEFGSVDIEVKANVTIERSYKLDNPEKVNGRSV